MRTVPRNKQPQLSFFNVHVPRWAEHAAALGLDPGEIATMQTLLARAREADDEQRQALLEAQTKTQALNDAMEAMRRHGAGLIAQIRGQSALVGPEVYPLARLDVPQKGSPLAPPGTPDRFEARLTTLGSVVLTWACKHPRGARGTTYQISRRLNTDPGGWGAPFTYVGLAGRRRFEDATLPPDAKWAEYRVRAVRSTASGQSAIHTVYFGSAANGLPMPGDLQLAA